MRENRIKVVLLYDKNMGHQEIKEILLLDLQTIRRYINDFIHYRMDSIYFEDGRKDRSGNKKKLTAEQEEQVKQFVQENLIEEAKEVQSYIKEHFSISYHVNSVINLLHHLGFSYKKVVTIPQQSNTTQSIEKQLEFEARYKRLKEELKEDEEILFLDGVHPTHNTKAGFAWIQNGEVITLSCETINSDSTLKLFDTLLETYSNTTGNLYLFADNARYYKSKLLQEALKTDKYKRIKMIFLPSYSPNLNPIEKVWKFFKNEVLKNKFYKTLNDFKIAIDVFFHEKIRHPHIKEKLKRVASDNFHIRHRNLCYLPLSNEGFQVNYFGR